MALLPFKLPRIQANIPIVDAATGKAKDYFLRLLNIDVFLAIERAINSTDQNVLDLQQAFAAIQAATQIAQASQQTANEGVTGGVSGSATGTNDPIPVVWSAAATVSLTGVTAGNLSISGTGPQQTDDVLRSGKGSTTGQFRVVEVVGMVDTVLFTGDFYVYNALDDNPPTVVNSSATAVAAFSSARSSTGAVDYRIDVRTTGSGDVFSLTSYLFVRRS